MAAVLAVSCHVINLGISDGKQLSLEWWLSWKFLWKFPQKFNSIRYQRQSFLYTLKNTVYSVFQMCKCTYIHSKLCHVQLKYLNIFQVHVVKKFYYSHNPLKLLLTVSMSRKIPQKVKTQWKWKTTNGKVAIDKNIDVRILSFHLFRSTKQDYLVISSFTILNL